MNGVIIALQSKAQLGHLYATQNNNGRHRSYGIPTAQSMAFYQAQ